jgi:hypothetical protein
MAVHVSEQGPGWMSDLTQIKIAGPRGTWSVFSLCEPAHSFGVDVVFFRNRFWERLIVNVGIVLVFAAFTLRFLPRP